MPVNWISSRASASQGRKVPDSVGGDAERILEDIRTVYGTIRARLLYEAD